MSTRQFKPATRTITKLAKSPPLLQSAGVPGSFDFTAAAVTLAKYACVSVCPCVSVGLLAALTSRLLLRWQSVRMRACVCYLLQGKHKHTCIFLRFTTPYASVCLFTLHILACVKFVRALILTTSWAHGTSTRFLCFKVNDLSTKGLSVCKHITTTCQVPACVTSAASTHARAYAHTRIHA